MKTIKVTIALAAAMFLFGMPGMQAQENDKGSELSVAFQGLGIGSMPFSGTATWEDQPGLSLGFNAGYTYWFGKHFGFRTGVRMTRFSHNQKISNLDLPITTSLPMSSIGLPGGSASTTVELNATATSVQEEQNATFVELPIQLAMRFGKAFVNLGVSLSKAVNATADYSFTDPTLSITALPDLGVTPTTPVPMTLTGATEKSVKNADMTKPFQCLLDAEVGMNFPLSDAACIALGLYGRLAPVAYKTDNTANLYVLNPDATYTLTQPSTALQVEKIGYYEVGVSLGFNFGLGRRQAKATPEATQDFTNEPMLQVDSELAAMRAAQKKTEEELANVKAAQRKAEDQLAAMKAAQQKAEAEMASRMANGTASAVSTAADEITVNFNNNDTKPLIDQAMEVRLRALCAAMKADKKMQVLVTGNADSMGNSQANLELGQRRAEAVKQLMAEWGAPAQNIKCESKGDKNPVAGNSTEEGRAQNRRVTVKCI